MLLAGGDAFDLRRNRWTGMEETLPWNGDQVL
jgi:hypothetical protein